MSRLYPSLDDKFRSEGICPICLVEMADSPRFSCDHDHVICQRCRAYFFNCPKCLQPLHEIAPPHEQFMPHPPPQSMSHPYPPPSAPSLDDFHEHERRSSWTPQPMPRRQSELLDCPYAHLGCTAKFVEALRDMHVSRCQYKHHTNEEHLTQVTGFGDSEDVACRYETHGCNVHLPLGRLRSHEEICIYKNRAPSPSFDCPPSTDDRVDCKYQSVGCNVRLPHYRLHDHEEICIYKDREPSPPPQSFEDDRIFCRYQSVGCNVRLPHYRLDEHEAMCVYKDREPPRENYWDERVACRYQSVGCNVRVPHERMRDHEEICIYKDREVEELGSRMQSTCYVQESVAGCRYRDWGCNVRMPYERLRGHEEICIYKDRV